jgi:hypothetical protein
MMMTTQASMGNQTMKAKRPREGGFCATFSFLGFVSWWVLFFSLYVFVKPRKFFL